MDLSDWSPRSVIADVTQARTQASNALVRTSIASKLSKFKLPRWDARAPTVSFTLDGALQLVDYIIETPPGIEPERKTHIAKFMSDPNGLNGALARNPNYLQNGAKGIATYRDVDLTSEFQEADTSNELQYYATLSVLSYADMSPGIMVLQGTPEEVKTTAAIVEQSLKSLSNERSDAFDINKLPEAAIVAESYPMDRNNLMEISRKTNTGIAISGGGLRVQRSADGNQEFVETGQFTAHWSLSGEPRLITISYRGSDNARDWLGNLDIVPRTLPAIRCADGTLKPLAGEMHAGFRKASYGTAAEISDVATLWNGRRSEAEMVPVEREIRQVFDIAKAVFPDVSPLRPVAIAGSGHSRAHAQVQQFARVLVEQMPDLEALGLTLTKIQTFGGPAYSNLTYGQAFMRQVERVNKRANTYVEVSRVVGYMDPVPALQGLGAGERDEIAYHVGSAIYLRPADQDDLGRIRWALVLKHDEPNTVKSNVRGRFSQEPWEVVPLRLRCLGLWHGSHGIRNYFAALQTLKDSPPSK